MKLKFKLLSLDELEDGEIKGIECENVISIISHPHYKYVFVFYKE